MANQRPSTSRSVNDKSITRLEMDVENYNQAIKEKTSTRKKLFSECKSLKLDHYRRSVIERAIKGRMKIFNEEPEIAWKTSTPMPKCTNRKANNSNNTSSLSISPIKKTEKNLIGGDNNNNSDNNKTNGSLSTNKSNRSSNTSKVKAYNKNVEKSVDNEQYKNNSSQRNRSKAINVNQSLEKSVNSRQYENSITQRSNSESQKNQSVQIHKKNSEELIVNVQNDLLSSLHCSLNSLNNINNSSNTNNNVERLIVDQISPQTTNKEQQFKQFGDVEEAELEQFLSEVDNLIFWPDDNMSSSKNDIEISTRKPWRNSKSFLLPRMSSGSFGKNPSFVKTLNNKLPVKCSQKKSFVNKKSLGVKLKNNQQQNSNETVDNRSQMNGLNTNRNDNVDDVDDVDDDDDDDDSDKDIELDSVLNYLSSALGRDDVSFCVVDEEENCDEIRNVQKPTKKYTKRKRSICVNNQNIRKDDENNLMTNDNNEKNLNNLVHTVQASISNDRNDTKDIDERLKSKNNNSTVVNRKSRNNEGKDAVDRDVQQDNITQLCDNRTQNNDNTNRKSKKISNKNRKINKKQKKSEHIPEPSSVHENNKEETMEKGLRRSTRERKLAPFNGVVVYTTSKRLAKDFGQASNDQQIVNTRTRKTISRKRKSSVESTASRKSHKKSRNTRNIAPLSSLKTIAEITNNDEGYSTNENLLTSSCNRNNASLIPLTKAKIACKEIHINDICGYFEVPPCATQLKLSIHHHPLNLFIIYGKGEISIGGVVKEFKELDRFIVGKGQNFYVTNMGDSNDHVLIHYDKVYL